MQLAAYRLLLISTMTLVWPGAALAGPTYSCNGVGVAAAGGVVLDPDNGGLPQCVIADGATVSLSGHVSPAADLTFATHTQYDYVGSTVRLTDDVETEALPSQNHTTQFVYDSQPRLTRVTDTSGNGIVTRYQYDYDPNRNRPTTITDPQGRSIQFHYDADSRVTQITGTVAGHPDDYKYDAQGRLAQVLDDNGNILRYSYDYDGLDRLVRTTDPQGNVTTYQYDGLNRLTRTIEQDDPNNPNPPPPLITRYTYDALDRRIQTDIDPNGKLTTYQYDALNRLVGDSNDPDARTDFIYSAAIPEPGTLALLAIGIAGTLVRRRRSAR